MHDFGTFGGPTNRRRVQRRRQSNLQGNSDIIAPPKSPPREDMATQAWTMPPGTVAAVVPIRGCLWDRRACIRVSPGKGGHGHASVDHATRGGEDMATQAWAMPLAGALPMGHAWWMIKP